MASVVSDSEWPYGQQSTRLLHPQDSPGKNIGVGCHFVLHIRKYKNVWQLQKPNQKSCVACTQGKWRKTVWKPWMPCFSMWTLFPQPTERQQRLFLNKGNGVLCAPEQWHDPATLGLGNTQSLNHVRLFATPQTVVCQAPLSTGILQATILERMPWPSPGGLPNLGIKPTSPMSPALAGGFFYTESELHKRPPGSKENPYQWKH